MRQLQKPRGENWGSLIIDCWPDVTIASDISGYLSGADRDISQLKCYTLSTGEATNRQGVMAIFDAVCTVHLITMCE